MLFPRSNVRTDTPTCTDCRSSLKCVRSFHCVINLSHERTMQLMDSSPEEGTGAGHNDAQSPQPTASTSNGNNKAAKSDTEKEQQRAEEEAQKARMALQKFGRRRFMQGLWGLFAMDNPDSIMLRFLRARKWNPGAALAMMCTCVKWRIDYGVDKIASSILSTHEQFPDQTDFFSHMK